jgi:predicted nucleic acid-binding protein
LNGISPGRQHPLLRPAKIRSHQRINAKLRNESLYSRIHSNEFFKHLDELETKTHLNKEEIRELMLELLTQANVKVIPKDELKNFMDQAGKSSPDPDDAIYFAAALKLKCGIWSNDKKLKEQGEVKVYSTQDLVEIF